MSKLVDNVSIQDVDERSVNDLTMNINNQFPLIFAETLTTSSFLKPLETAGLSEPYQARGSYWPAKCLV